MGNKLVTYFNEDEIKEIYDYVVAYSVKYYESNDNLHDDILKKRYTFSKSIMNPEIDLPLEELKNYIMEKSSKFELNIKDNKPVIDSYAPIAVCLFKNYFDYYCKDQSDINKLNYIFDFITNYVSYSENEYKYSLLIPPVDYFMNFNFKNGVPVNEDVKSLIVQGQGMCNEISLLFIHLGKVLGLEINREFALYNNVPHAFNSVIIDGKKTLIDATKAIRKDMCKEECFLVSKERLNKTKLYEFNQFGEEDVETYSINYTDDVNYDINYIINEIKKSMPKIIPVGFIKKENIR